MKMIEIKLYKFNELSEQAKQKAIENLSDINVECDWWESTYEDAERIGLKITGFDLDRNRHATGELMLSPSEICANIIRDHGEQCETYKLAENFLKEFKPIFAEHFQTEEGEYKLIELENDFLQNLLNAYSIMLQNESEYLQGKEAIIETIQANDYDFTEDGKLY
jgi:hypothetical protein